MTLTSLVDLTHHLLMWSFSPTAWSGFTNYFFYLFLILAKQCLINFDFDKKAGAAVYVSLVSCQCLSVKLDKIMCLNGVFSSSYLEFCLSGNVALTVWIVRNAVIELIWWFETCVCTLACIYTHMHKHTHTHTHIHTHHQYFSGMQLQFQFAFVHCEEDCRMLPWLH